MKAGGRALFLWAGRKTISFVCVFALMMIVMKTAGQTPFISIDKTSYVQGDTISFNCDIEKYRADSIHFASLFLVIENIQTKKKWRLRYPVVDGIVGGDIALNKHLPSGIYAMNFYTSKQFFKIEGMLNDYDFDKDIVSVRLSTKNNNAFYEKLNPTSAGKFILKGILFQDSSTVSFSSKNPDRNKPLQITLRTELDSNVSKDLRFQQFVTIGNVTRDEIQIKSYQFTEEPNDLDNTLPEVTVTGIKKTKLELFNEEFSTGLFKTGESKVFDGIEDTRIRESMSIISFLRGRIAGLRITQSGSRYLLQWGGPVSLRANVNNVDVYLDESRIDQVTDNIISPSDVAMIKVFPPPSFIGFGGSKGVIAIYTKRGEFDAINVSNRVFSVYGYTPLLTVMQ